jgi:D-arabinose 1-dehydrogenase-like Zn-dependent alcohol dehydrogenase
LVITFSLKKGSGSIMISIIPLGLIMDGGYAEVMIAEARGIAPIPDELKSAEAAPLL